MAQRGYLQMSGPTAPRSPLVLWSPHLAFLLKAHVRWIWKAGGRSKTEGSEGLKARVTRTDVHWDSWLCGSSALGHHTRFSHLVLRFWLCEGWLIILLGRYRKKTCLSNVKWLFRDHMRGFVSMSSWCRAHSLTGKNKASGRPVLNLHQQLCSGTRPRPPCGCIEGLDW